MKKKIAIIATAVLVVATIAIGSTLAFFTDKGEVNNVITTGNVKISLDEPMFKDSGANQDGEDIYMPNDVMPNQPIVKDPTITNEGSHDAYIRCKVTVSSKDGKMTADRIADVIKGLNINTDTDTDSAWVLSDGYYYYQKPLPKIDEDSTKHSVQFFTTFTVPETWDNTMADTRFKIAISAEAIQADYFTPTKDADGKYIGWNYSAAAGGSSVPVLVASSAGAVD
jgi:predicted ribosomally synthesized peptide with SipW-like signal peptide